MKLGLYTKFLSATICFNILIQAHGFGQLSKGDFLAGGNLSVNTTRNYRQGELTDKGMNIQASPVFGYFLANRLAGGIRINYSYSQSKNLVSGFSYKSHGRELGTGPFVRYYFLPESKKINILTEASFVFSSYKTVSGNQIYKSEMQTLGIAAGPAFFLNPKLALEILAGYRRQQISKDNFVGNVFQIQFGLQFYPGHLGKK